MQIETFALTDAGSTGKHNEDNLTTLTSADHSLHLVAVADGMGGHAAGDFASQVVIDSLKVMMTKLEERAAFLDTNIISEQLRNAIDVANQHIHTYAQKHLAGAPAGSTLTAAILHKNQAIIANVGDSRTYLWRQHALNQLTVDHSLVELFVREGVITHDERYVHNAKNVVTKAIGPDATLEADIVIRSLRDDDCLLLCSDGLSDMLHGSKGMQPYLHEDWGLEKVGRALVDAANDAGGLDNISIVLAKISTHSQ